MTRLFILAPNLKNKLSKNPRFFIIRDTWIKEHVNKPYEIKVKNGKGEVLFTRPRITKWNERKGVGMYVVYYRRLWNKFLNEYIDDSEKKINSPFKKGECYNFKLKK
jgi:hypothetical protein